ncbi:MAG: methyltransferase domain-containing protein [Sulfurimonas sp.]|nr:methyltransferase domain-containing protein [Sulfurimonas sp.]
MQYNGYKSVMKKANIAFNTHKYKDAIVFYLEALQLDSSLELYLNLGSSYFYLNNILQAKECFEKALEFDKNNYELLWNLSSVYEHTNEIKLAQSTLLKAINIASNKQASLHKLSTIMYNRFFHPTLLTDETKNIIILLFNLKGVNYENLKPCLIQFLLTEDIKTEINAFNSQFNILTFHDKPLILKLLNNELLHLLLKKTIYINLSLEFFLLKIRKSILNELVLKDLQWNNFKNIEKFIIAFAQQQFYNEFIMIISDQEKIHLDQLKIQIAALIKNNDKKVIFYISLLATYFPLNQFKFMQEKFIKKLCSKNNAFKELVTIHLDEPHQEYLLRNSIDTLSIVDNITSKKVKNQYESNPYPRWISIHKPNAQQFSTYLQNSFYIESEILQTLPATTIKILVAGSGTGRQPINISYKIYNTSILAIDLSKSSLSYAKRKTEELNIKNIKFLQADILDLDLLDEQYHLIESIGVLHHMENPINGWQVLLNRLKPNGLLKIGLYSTIARKTVTMVRNFIKDNKLPINDDSIRDVRQYILNLNDLNLNELSKANDFYYTSGVRDLLFHVQEKTYTILELEEIFNILDLTFLGFEIKPKIKETYNKEYPNDTKMRSLKNWHQFEQKYPDTFTGMYNFFVIKNKDYMKIMKVI